MSGKPFETVEKRAERTRRARERASEQLINAESNEDSKQSREKSAMELELTRLRAELRNSEAEKEAKEEKRKKEELSSEERRLAKVKRAYDLSDEKAGEREREEAAREEAAREKAAREKAAREKEAIKTAFATDRNSSEDIDQAVTGAANRVFGDTYGKESADMLSSAFDVLGKAMTKAGLEAGEYFYKEYKKLSEGVSSFDDRQLSAEEKGKVSGFFKNINNYVKKGGDSMEKTLKDGITSVCDFASKYVMNPGKNLASLLKKKAQQLSDVVRGKNQERVL